MLVSFAGPKGEKGDIGPIGPQGPQGPQGKQTFPFCIKCFIKTLNTDLSINIHIMHAHFIFSDFIKNDCEHSVGR